VTQALKGISIGGAGASFGCYANRKIRTVAYDFADARPRPEKAVTLFTPGSWESSALSARQVATCLSYYAGRNLPRFRGRIYIGPWNKTDVDEKPSSLQRLGLVDLGHALYNIATQPSSAFTHSVHSVAAGTVWPVTNYWTNDVWDTQRSRAQRESLRTTYP
jgi:hypothetical protein